MNRLKESGNSIYPGKSVTQKSYDNGKTHGGELKVETKVGEGSALIILFPVD